MKISFLGIELIKKKEITHPYTHTETQDYKILYLVYATDGMSKSVNLEGNPINQNFVEFSNSNDFIGNCISHHRLQLGE